MKASSKNPWLLCLVLTVAAIGFSMASLQGFKKPPSHQVMPPDINPMEVLHLITGELTLGAIELERTPPIETPVNLELAAIPRVIAKDIVQFTNKTSPDFQLDDVATMKTIQALIDPTWDRQTQWHFALGLLRTERVLLKHQTMINMARQSSPSIVLGPLIEIYPRYFIRKSLKEAEKVDQAQTAHAALMHTSQRQLLISLALMIVLLATLGLKLRPKP